MDETKLSTAEHIDLLQILRALARKWSIIVLIGIFTAAIGFSYANYFITPLYRASSCMLIDLRNSVHEDLSAEQVSIAQKYVTTFAYVINSNTVLDPVIEKLDLDESSSTLASKLQVSEVEDTFLIKVSIDYPDKKEALAIIEAIGEVAPGVINEQITAGYIIEIERPAVSGSPVSPNIAKYTMLGGFAGVVLSAGIIIAFQLFNNKIRSANDLQTMLDLPILGVIPTLNNSEAKGA